MGDASFWCVTKLVAALHEVPKCGSHVVCGETGQRLLTTCCQVCSVQSWEEDAGDSGSHSCRTTCSRHFSVEHSRTLNPGQKL